MKINKKLMLVACISSLLLAGCSSTSNGTVVMETQGNGQPDMTINQVTNNDFATEDLVNDWNTATAEKVQLAETSITYEGNNATVDGSTITIQKPGIFEISGNLQDGQIVVDTKDAGTVQLVLNNANITSTSTAPVYVNQAEKTMITVAGDSDNSLRDSATSKIEQNPEDVEAAIYSNSPIVVNGLGTLYVEGNKANGIVCNSDLKFASGSITVQSAKTGIESSTCILVKNGSYNVNAGESAIKASEGDSYIAMEGGNFTMSSGSDAIFATGDIYILNGIYQINAGAGNETSDNAKGLKSNSMIEVYGGSVNIKTLDDAINAKKKVEVKSGNVNIETNNSGIHSQEELAIGGGSIILNKCKQGLTANDIKLTGGYVNVISSEDAIATENGSVDISECYVSLEALQDGMDVNGDITINSGNIIVTGSSDTGFNSIKATGKYQINGGTVITSDASDAAILPDKDSKQNCIVMTFNEMQDVNNVFYVEDASGNSILSFSGKNPYKNLIISKPEIEINKIYSAYEGTVTKGSEEGDNSADSYTKGEKILDFTPAEVITNIHN